MVSLFGLYLLFGTPVDAMTLSALMSTVGFGIQMFPLTLAAMKAVEIELVMMATRIDHKCVLHRYRYQLYYCHYPCFQE